MDLGQISFSFFINYVLSILGVNYKRIKKCKKTHASSWHLGLQRWGIPFMYKRVLSSIENMRWWLKPFLVCAINILIKC